MTKIASISHSMDSELMIAKSGWSHLPKISKTTSSEWAAFVKSKCLEIGVRPEKNSAGVFQPAHLKHLCWMLSNGVLRKDTLKRLGIDIMDVVKFGISEIPVCGTCGKDLYFTCASIPPFCDNICKKQSPRYLEKNKTTGQSAAKARVANGTTKNAWTPEARFKREASKLAKYGHKTGFCGATEQKRKLTLLSKYGTTDSFSTSNGKISRVEQKKKEKESSLARLLSLNPEIRNVNWNGHGLKSEWSCSRCNAHFSIEQSNPSVRIRCPTCDGSQSLIQDSLYEFLKREVGSDIIKNTRKIIPPMELDIFIPDKMVAVEVNGLYWHSFAGKETKKEIYYHMRKWEMCSQQGITLLTFFEDDISLKPDIVKSMILSKCGIFAKKLRASKLEISEIKNPKQFFEDNHLNGYGRPGSLCIGLRDSDSVVCSAASFGFNKKLRMWELLRFASKKNTHISGALSRIVKHAKSLLGCDKIASYSNNCHSTGHSYKSIGGESVKSVPPGYFWWKNNWPSKRARQHFQKSKLRSLLGEKFNANETEYANLFRLGYRRLWDCGHLLHII